jgi:hypothetical protein
MIKSEAPTTMMPPPARAIQPQIASYLRRLNRGKIHQIQLIETRFKLPNETLSAADGEALSDIAHTSGELASILQERANERRTAVKAQLVIDGEGAPEPLHLIAHPEHMMAGPRRGAVDELTWGNGNGGGDGAYEIVDDENGESNRYMREDGSDGWGPFGHRPTLRDQAAAFASDAIQQTRAMFKLTMGAALERERRDAAEIARLRDYIRKLMSVHEQAVLEREDLLDRKAHRQLEVDRIKTRDKWMQDGFSKVVAIVALHAPALLVKFGGAMDARAKEILFDIVSGVESAKPYVNAMRAASAIADKGSNGSNGSKTTNGANGPAPEALALPPHTTAGAIASATIEAPEGVKVAASAVAIFASWVVEFLQSARPKLVLARGALDEKQNTQLDKILEVMDQQGEMFLSVGRAAVAGTVKAMDAPPGSGPGFGAEATSDDEKKMSRLIDLSAQFWMAIRPSDADEMRKFLPLEAREALDEVRRDYDFSAAKSN